jgi:hypothetical protein
MRKFALLGCSLFLAATGATAADVVVTDLGDAVGTCPSATDCTLRAAIDAALSNDTIVFDPALTWPANLQLVEGQLAVSKSLTIRGPGSDRLTIIADSGSRVFEISGATLVIQDLSLGGGFVSGSNGLSQGAGTGLAGQIGGSAEGGCVRVPPGGSLVLERAAVRGCVARGGNGGNGGSGGTGNNGGGGGSGGAASGGGIFVRGDLALIDSSVSESTALGGDGGSGGDGGDIGVGSAGNGGGGGTGGTARGGAIYVGFGGSLLMRNSTATGGGAESGSGGDGGDGGTAGAGTDGNGGNGAGGGAARGGQIHLAAEADSADIEFVTLGPSNVNSGFGGDGGSGNINGMNGVNGVEDAESLFAGLSPRVHNSVFVGNSLVDDCAGPLTTSGVNLDSDSTCIGFDGTVDYVGNFAGPGPLIENGRTAVPPRANSPTIDAAENCEDLAAVALTSDQSGRARPLDGDGDTIAACDIGAIEFSFDIFADGFEE